jgi:hypothetical protein
VVFCVAMQLPRCVSWSFLVGLEFELRALCLPTELHPYPFLL